MHKFVFWKNPHYQRRPALAGRVSCDYLIVGGGVTGVSLAYFLNRLGTRSIIPHPYRARSNCEWCYRALRGHVCRPAARGRRG